MDHIHVYYLPLSAPTHTKFNKNTLCSELFLETATKGHFTHEPRAAIMKL